MELVGTKCPDSHSIPFVSHTPNTLYVIFFCKKQGTQQHYKKNEREESTAEILRKLPIKTSIEESSPKPWFLDD